MTQFLRLFTIGILSPADRSLIHRASELLGYSQRLANLPVVGLGDVLPDIVEVKLSEQRADDSNISLLEILALTELIKVLKPRVVFEIGTFDGRTTLNLAANVPPAAKVYTLDLPKAAAKGTRLPLDPAERRYIAKDLSGSRYLDSAYQSQIIQLYGDSAAFDFAPFRNSIDFVFVDGSHAYEYVLSDTNQAMQLLRNGKGMIV